VALLSAVPQTTLSVTFLNSLINSQFISQISDVFKSAWGITIEYYQGKVNNLKTFGGSPLLDQFFQSVEQNPQSVWETIKTINPEIQFFQVFSEQAEETFFMGVPEARIRMLFSLEMKSGMLPKIERGNITLFRYLYVLKQNNGKINYIIFGIALPKGFNEEAQRLSDSKEIFEQLNRFKDFLQAGIILFYFFFSFPILLLSIFVSFLLSDEIIRPIINLEEATRRVAQGDLSIRILARSGDELANLIDSFNSMVSELDSSKRKISKTEKIAAWQEIAQRLAHEIKNPLTPIKLAAERIKKKFDEQAWPGNGGFKNIIESSVQAIIVEVDNLDKMLKEFNDFAKLPDPRREQVDLKALVEEVVSIYTPVAVNVNINTEFVNPSLLLFIDRNQFKQVFANLMINAFQAMPGGGNIFIRADLVKKEKTNYCRIQVRDTGTGIEEATQPSIFNPYFTTKQGGTGLGLSIVERIVFDHNGNIWFETKRDVGTTFFIDIPVENE
jgi:nitrogen fixation/metabolism regulation signal transduction histidine kinase